MLLGGFGEIKMAKKKQNPSNGWQIDIIFSLKICKIYLLLFDLNANSPMNLICILFFLFKDSIDFHWNRPLELKIGKTWQGMTFEVDVVWQHDTVFCVTIYVLELVRLDLLWSVEWMSGHAWNAHNTTIASNKILWAV